MNQSGPKIVCLYFDRSSRWMSTQSKSEYRETAGMFIEKPPRVGWMTSSVSVPIPLEPKKIRFSHNNQNATKKFILLHSRLSGSIHIINSLQVRARFVVNAPFTNEFINKLRVTLLPKLEPQPFISPQRARLKKTRGADINDKCEGIRRKQSGHRLPRCHARLQLWPV
jgi:hypothetical protein